MFVSLITEDPGQITECDSTAWKVNVFFSPR